MTSISNKWENSPFTTLYTVIPTETFNELTEMAKERATCTGKWDYGNTIRELIWAYRVFYNMNTRIDELENSFKELKAFVMEHDLKKQEPKEKEEKKNPDGLLGRKHLKEQEEKEDGKKD